jgi:chemosensory pili system protein ChpC
MSFAGEELYSLLVPLGGDRIIIPRSCVAEVVRYSPSEQESDGWLRDSLRWRERDVPVISFDTLLGAQPPSASGRTRVVIFNPIGADPECPPYGLLAQGFPQMVRVNSEVVQRDKNYSVPEGAPVICQISMLNEYALIPDLEKLEQNLIEALALTD